MNLVILLIVKIAIKVKQEHVFENILCEQLCCLHCFLTGLDFFFFISETAKIVIIVRHALMPQLFFNSLTTLRLRANLVAAVHGYL